MGNHALLHPTEQTLSDFSLGKLNDVRAEIINSHLSECPDCQRLVAEMSSDSFLGRLRDVRGRVDSAAPVGSSLAGLSRIAGEPTSVEPPPSSSLPPGLADHPDYEVVRELGQGGMGTVYLAQNRLMGRHEVLKVVSSHLIKRRGVLDRFLGEIRNAARLHHTNIVTAYSAMRIGESIVFAMEYVEGLDLSRLVKTKGPLPVAHACNFVYQAALGLQHAYEQGMVHRDIKPSNLMLSRQGKRALIKVLDFGLAKVKSEGTVDSGLTHEGQMLGTPDFIAPEQTVDARKADIRADIYSLGCTLYYLLTGSPPFQATSLYELLQAHHSMDALPLNLARPEVPVEVAAIVAKMMAKEPQRRFQQPKEVAQALLPFFKKGPVGAAASKAEMSQLGGTNDCQASTAVSSVSTQPASGAASKLAPLVKSTEASARPEAMWESLIETRDTEPATDAAPAVAETKRRRPRASWPLIITASVLGFLSLGVIIYVSNNKGRIKIEINDPNVVVTIDNGDTFSVEGLGEPITLSAGDHDLKVKRGDFVLQTRKFSVFRGENEPLRIEFQPKEGGMLGGMMGGGMMGGGTKDSAPTGSGMGGMMGGGMMGGGMMGGGTKDSAPTGSGMGGMMGGGMMGGGMMGGGTKDSAPTSPEENEIKKSPAAAAVGEIRPLNGRNFEGWNGLFFKKEVIDPSKVFRIEGDELVWAGHAGRIFTNNSFRDFSFKFEYLLPLNGRYGTTYCLFKLAEGDPYQVGEANFRVGGVRCALTNGQEGKTGDIVLTRYDLENTDRYLAQRTADATRPANEWNEVEIRCEGRVIQFFLNGREVNRVEGNRAITCHPGFHCDATDIRIRNIRIIPLASAGVAPAPKNSGRLKVQNKPASRKAAKKIVVDALQPGTAWEGTWTYEDPEYSGQRASYRLTISERSGDHFKAVSDYQYGTFSVRSNVEGTIQGDHIDYKEVGREKWRYSSLGTIVGNEINSRFQGTGAAGKARFGKGQMKLQEK